jgi:hypothetical protein
VPEPSAARVSRADRSCGMSLTDLMVWGVILGGFAAAATAVLWLAH